MTWMDAAVGAVLVPWLVLTVICIPLSLPRRKK